MIQSKICFLNQPWHLFEASSHWHWNLLWLWGSEASRQCQHCTLNVLLKKGSTLTGQSSGQESDLHRLQFEEHYCTNPEHKDGKCKQIDLWYIREGGVWKGKIFKKKFFFWQTSITSAEPMRGILFFFYFDFGLCFQIDIKKNPLQMLPSKWRYEFTSYKNCKKRHTNQKYALSTIV